MDWITLFIILLAATLIVGVVASIKPADENDDGISSDAEITDRDLGSEDVLSEAPFVPEIGLSDLVAILPQEYWPSFEHPSDEPYVIPQENPIVGDLRILLVWREAIVVVGKHTELRFNAANAAFKFVDKVLRDEIVFRIGEAETDICPIEDFEGPAEAGRDDHVWSGPLKHKLLFRS